MSRDSFARYQVVDSWFKQPVVSTPPTEAEQFEMWSMEALGQWELLQTVQAVAQPVKAQAQGAEDDSGLAFFLSFAVLFGLIILGSIVL